MMYRQEGESHNEWMIRFDELDKDLRARSLRGE